MNMLFKNNYDRKISRCDRNIHQVMQIPVDVYQTNKKLCVVVQPKNASKLEFHIIYGYHLLINLILTF